MSFHHLVHKKYLYLLSFIFIFSFISFSSAVAIDNPNIPIVKDFGLFDNYTAYVNNSHLWNGYLWSDTRWLNIDGSNANQNINISQYDLALDILNAVSLYGDWYGGNIFNDVDMNDNHITNLGGIYFNTTHEVTTPLEEGLINWDSNAGTLAVGLGGGNVNLQVGFEQVIKVRNNAGYDILDGKAVYISGALGERPTIEYSDATDSDTIAILGVATENISNGGQGYVTRKGLIHDIDTSSWNEGDKLYLTTNGDYSNHQPVTSTAATVIVGYVIKVSENEGIILVEPEMFSIGNNFNGTLRMSILNKNETGASGFTAVNNMDVFTTIGVAGSEHPAFPANSTILYGSGYGDQLIAVDGNKSFIWYNDPEDRHNNGALEYENMRLTPLGDLILRGKLRGGFIDKYDTGVFNGSLYTDGANSTGSESNSLFQVISDTRGTPQFMVQDGGPEQASFITRSFMIVNQNNTLLNSSQNNICSEWGFDQLDCNTASTGADLGVSDDLQALGLIYGSGLRAYAREGIQRALLIGTENITTLFSGFNGSYNVTENVFCDYVSNNFYQTDAWININDIDSEFEGAWANVGTVINSSCLQLINNPGWKTSFSGVEWRAVNDPALIYLQGGFGEYYVGDSPLSAFEFNIKNGTGRYGVVIDDTVGSNSHSAFRIEQDLKGLSGVAQNIFVTSSEELLDKSLVMLSMVGDASKMNSSDGVFIDMQIIGQPLNSDGNIDGIHMPAGLDNIIKVGDFNYITKAYSNAKDITTNSTSPGLYSPIFELDNDVLYIGNSVNFTNIGITLSTPASATINPLYFYCNSSGDWEPLTGVVSTTNGFSSSGLISFTNPLDRGTCNKQLNGTLFANTTNYNYIAIQRTRNFIVTSPVLDIISISGAESTMFLKESMLRLSPLDIAPELCTGINLGAIYYDISEDDMCVCKSTGWKVMTDGSACT